MSNPTPEEIESALQLRKALLAALRDDQHFGDDRGVLNFIQGWMRGRDAEVATTLREWLDATK